jgi:hypothetical protein
VSKVTEVFWFFSSEKTGLPLLKPPQTPKIRPPSLDVNPKPPAAPVTKVTRPALARAPWTGCCFNVPMRRENLLSLGLMLALLLTEAAIWFPLLPNKAGFVSVDFSLWLPDMLAGYYWYLRNGFLAMPWFSPSQCAGIPFHADPQVFFLSLPQFLTFIMPPLDAVRCSFLAFAAAGYLGMWHLARRSFALPLAASLLAAALFMLNGFFAVRMVVGHITYAPFMLAPAFAAAILRPPGLPPPLRTETVFRVIVGGLCLAVAIEGGMVHIIPPMLASLVAVGLVHGLRHGGQGPAAARFALACAVGVAMCAGKLAAGLSLLAHVPRDLYPLPGIAGLPDLLYVSVRSLFTPVPKHIGAFIVHSKLIQEKHEFEYGVGPVPAVLMLAAAGFAVSSWWRNGQAWRWPAPGRLAMLAALAAILCVPLALNLFLPGWNAWLKSLPYFGSSSNLLRWFCLWIMPAVLGGAIALAALARRWPGFGLPLAGAGVVLTILMLLVSSHARYGRPPAGLGFYNAGDLAQAWQVAHDTGAPPPITAVARFQDANRHLLMVPERQNSLTQGYSTLFCYAPLFGYRQENFPFGKIRLGDALAERAGVLNFKNPACYVFPEANHCLPGDQFDDSQLDDLRIFLAYGPLAFAKPWYAELADWIGIFAALAACGLLGWSGWRM